MAAEHADDPQRACEAEPEEQKRDAKPDRVDPEQQPALYGTAARGGEREDRGQGWTDAPCPADAEGEPDERGGGEPSSALQVEALLT